LGGDARADHHRGEEGRAEALGEQTSWEGNVQGLDFSL
jgi:hypothetical protein